MSTQVFGGAKGRNRLGIALVTLALAVAIAVLAIQVTSIWPASMGSQVRPVPAFAAVTATDPGASVPGIRPRPYRERAGLGRSGQQASKGPVHHRPKWGP